VALMSLLGGGGGNRTRVRKYSALQALRPRRYMLSFVISLTIPTRRTGAGLAILWLFSGLGQGSPPSRSCG